MPARTSVEHKRKLGTGPGRDSSGHRLPVPVAVPEPLCGGAPPPPPKLGTDGLTAWNRMWSAGSAWLHPECDRGVMVRLCELIELRARVVDFIDSAGLTAAGSTGQVRAHPLLSTLLSLETVIGRLESEAGFTPASRSKLSASEVTRMGKLDEMMARRAAAAVRLA